MRIGNAHNGSWAILTSQATRRLRCRFFPGYTLKMNNTDKWLNLRYSIKSCQKCEGLNSKELGTENAPGYGNTNSRIIFIGQSLFTGGSGKLLDLAFE